jgi:hypothetical protein
MVDVDMCVYADSPIQTTPNLQLLYVYSSDTNTVDMVCVLKYVYKTLQAFYKTDSNEIWINLPLFIV